MVGFRTSKISGFFFSPKKEKNIPLFLGFLYVIVIIKGNSQISFFLKADYLCMAPHTDFVYLLS